MLYLVKLDNAYKIGFTEDLKTRLKSLFSTHVDCKLISTKLGNKKDEKEIHNLCNKFLIKNELFLLNNKVEEIFNTYVSSNYEKEVNYIKSEIDLAIDRYEYIIPILKKQREDIDNLTNLNKTLFLELKEVIDEMSTLTDESKDFKELEQWIEIE